MKFRKITAFLTSMILCSLSVLPFGSQAALLGDVNKSGSIDANDASVILAIYAGLSTGGVELSAEIRTAADVNRDKSIDSTDASAVLGYYAYLSTGGRETFVNYLDSHGIVKPVTLEEQYKMYSDELVQYINEARKSLGCNPVKIAPCLQEVSDIRAKELTQVFSHTRPNGLGFGSLLDQKRIGWYSYAENIAAGRSTPKATFEDWKSSTDGHWEHMIDPAFTHMTIGVVYDPDKPYRWYWQMSAIQSPVSLEGEYYP